MRKKQKIRILLFFFTGMLILSCNYDDEISTKSTESSAENYKLKKVYLKEYSKNTKLFKQINNVKSKNLKSYDSNGKIVYSSDNSFNINTDFATYIENNGKHSYTFKINRDNPEYLLENLILNSNDSLGYDAYIVQYDITESEFQLLKNNNFVNLSNKMTLLKLLDSNIVDDIFSKEQTVEIQGLCLNSLTVCASGDHFSENGAGGNLSSCTIPHTIVTVYAWSECTISIPIGGGGGSTGGTDGGGGGGSPGTGTGSTYDGSDPNIHGNGGITTFPTIDDDDNAPIDHVAALNKLTNNKKDGSKTNVKTRIDQLNTARLTSLKENGYMFDNDQNTHASYNQGSNFTAWADPGTSYYIMLHMHQDKYIPEGSTTSKPTNVAPSDTDVVGLLKLLDYTNNKNATSIIVNRLGTFAIRVDDKNKANDAYDALTSSTNNSAAIAFEEKYDELVMEPYEASPLDDNAVMDGFISFINTNLINGQSMGLSFYQAVFDSQGNIINWIKL